MTETEDQPEVLNDLLAALGESRAFYEDAASNLRSSSLRELFEQRAVQRAEFARQLQKETAVELDGETANLFAFFERGLLTVRAAMTIERDLTDDVVLADAQEQELKLLRQYLKAFDHELPAGVRDTLERQYAAIRVAASYIDAAGTEVDEAIVVALFATAEAARGALAELERARVPQEHVAVLAEEEAARAVLGDRQEEMTEASAGFGALGGGVFGGIFGLFSGLGMALVMGPLLVVGLPVAAGATAVGAAIGAAYGGMFGGLLGYGIADEEVQAYINGMRQGQVLVAAQVSEAEKERVMALLEAAGGSNVATRYQK